MISKRIREVIDRGDPRTKKVLFEALIHEIQIQSDDSLVPIFKIPMSGPIDEEPALDGLAPDESLTATRFAHCQLWWAILGSNQ